MKHITIDALQMPDLVPIALVRTILTPPRHGASPFGDEHGLYCWVDPWSGDLVVEAGDFTVSPFVTKSRSLCPACMVPNQEVSEPAPKCAHSRPVILKPGTELFVGPHLLGRFRATGEWNDLPDKLWDVLEAVVYREVMNPAERGRWLLSR